MKKPQVIMHKKFDFSPELCARLWERAVAERVSEVAIVRRALEEYLAKEEAEA